MNELPPGPQELTTRRDYLAPHRRYIIGRALGAAVAGAAPLPMVDDWLVERVLGAGYRRLASDHQVDISAEAVTYLTHGPTPARSWGALATGAVVARLAARNWRRMLIAVTAARRAQAAARTFVAMTVFDHYCARRHVGLGLALDDAKRVRRLVAAAIDQTPGSLADGPFRQGARSAARAALRAPLEVVDTATGGRLRRLLGRGDPDEAQGIEVTALEQRIDAALAEHDGVLGKAVVAIELNLMAETNPYLDAVLRTFDRLLDEEAA
jgi:hypothetical protein